MRGVPAVLFSALLCASTASAGEPTGLLFSSVETGDGTVHGTIGWLGAPAGLDRSGPVFTVEVGRPWVGEVSGSAMGGWRIASGRMVATILGGVEVGKTARPKGSVDLWWDEAGYMATARAQATPDYVSWRTAIGVRPMDRLPFLGPELSSKDDVLRIGAHATGLDLPYGFQARGSGGWAEDHVYGELSVWRRF